MMVNQALSLVPCEALEMGPNLFTVNQDKAPEER